MELDIEGILTRVSNHLLEHTRQEMRSDFRDANANIMEVRADIRRLPCHQFEYAYLVQVHLTSSNLKLIVYRCGCRNATGMRQ